MIYNFFLIFTSLVLVSTVGIVIYIVYMAYSNTDEKSLEHWKMCCELVCKMQEKCNNCRYSTSNPNYRRHCLNNSQNCFSLETAIANKKLSRGGYKDRPLICFNITTFLQKLKNHIKRAITGKSGKK